MDYMTNSTSSFLDQSFLKTHQLSEIGNYVSVNLQLRKPTVPAVCLLAYPVEFACSDLLSSKDQWKFDLSKVFLPNSVSV